MPDIESAPNQPEQPSAVLEKLRFTRVEVQQEEGTPKSYVVRYINNPEGKVVEVMSAWDEDGKEWEIDAKHAPSSKDMEKKYKFTHWADLPDEDEG